MVYSGLPRYVIYLVVFTCTVIIHTTCLFLAPDEIIQTDVSDFRKKYAPAATSILNGNGYVLQPGRDLYTGSPPGYPLWLAGIHRISGETTVAPGPPIRFVNVITLGIAAVFLFLIAELMTTSTTAGTLTAFLWATYPLLLWIVPLPVSEIPFILFLYIGVWYTLSAIQRNRLPGFFGGGLFFGIAALVRSIGIIVTPAVFTVLIVAVSGNWKRKLLAGSLLITGLTLSVLPWEAYVYHETGNLIVLSSGGGAALEGGVTYFLRPQAQAAGVRPSEDVVDVMTRARQTWRQSNRSQTALREFLLNELIENPVPFLKIARMKMARAWYGTYTMKYDQWILVIQFCYLILLIPGILLVIREQKERRSLYAVPVVLLAAFYGMATVFPPNVRFLLPALGLMMVFPALTLRHAGQWILRKKRAAVPNHSHGDTETDANTDKRINGAPEQGDNTMSGEGRNLYAETGLSQIPHILSLIDRNRTSPTYGCFDRQYWHYKTAPFPSGMYQEFVLPLALVCAHRFPGGEDYYQQERLRELVAAGIRYAEKAAHSDGSCDDYFPYERALGAVSFSLYAMTESYLLLDFDDADMVKFLQKRAHWLMGYQESGQLSNHQALCLLALFNTYLITKDESFLDGVRHRLDVLREWQSDEGWFPEYEGCDPGYLSGTIDFLAKYFVKSQDESIVEPLAQAIRFAAQCAHPDGSYGGEYGSRNTNLYFPGGFEMMAGRIPEAAYLADSYLAGVKRDMRVHLEDDRMCAHLTYDHLQAYLAYDKTSRPSSYTPEQGSRHWEQSGFYFRRENNRYTALNTRKGGVVRLFSGENLAYADNGLVAKLSDGTVVVSQVVADNETNISDDTVSVAGTFAKSKFRLPTPFTQAVFHMGMVVLGRLWSNGVRILLQKILIVGKKFTDVQFRRTIRFGEKVTLVDDITLPKGAPRVKELYAGTDHTSIYIAVSQSFQKAALQPWTDLNEYVDELNTNGMVTIERDIA